MHYLLDTNTWILYLKQSSSSVESRLRQMPADRVAVCSIVWAELLHGARKYEKRDERVARIEQTIGPFRSFPFDDAAARKYALIRDTLETRGEVIGANDLLIAAIAIANNLVLVSSDQKFRRISELTVEDWTVA